MPNAKQTATISATILTEIAAKHLKIETLEEQGLDSQDFHDVAVWNIRAALEAAFAAGKASADLAKIG